MKKHFYQGIRGAFTFPKTYKEQIEQATDGAHFVEIGVYLGKSASFMAVEIANSGKNIKFDCVDTWSCLPQSVKELNLKNTIYKQFIKNMKPVEGYYNAIQLKSKEAALLYEDNSLDFVFIDAHHSFDEVTQDINCWYPKVKIGGTLAGHDYYPNSRLQEEVKQAVHTRFTDEELMIDPVSFTWSVIKK